MSNIKESTLDPVCYHPNYNILNHIPVCYISKHIYCYEHGNRPGKKMKG